VDDVKQNSQNAFVATDGGKTKSNAIAIPSVNLPKGGGAIKGVDEKFHANAVNGTAGLTIPLPFSPARGASPNLSLSYNSGSGNGVFGLGWKISLSSIKRTTDKKLPEYIDAIDSDTFSFSDAEDLVPEFKKENDGSFSVDANGDYIVNEKNSADGLFKIRYYRPRVDSLFARIERWTKFSTGIIKWRVITKDNNTTLFGWTEDSIIFDGNNKTRIFEWLPEFVFDDKGNCCQYKYKKEDKTGFPESFVHNRNRVPAGEISYKNLYIKEILYGNKTPYLQFGDPWPAESDYLFASIFDYGEYDTASPYSQIRDWDFRPDPFSDYKSGFEIRTTRLCQRVMLFHRFANHEYNGLVRSVHFKYDTTSEKGFTFLSKIISSGYIKKPDGSYSTKSLPPIEFEYQEHDWDPTVRTIDPDQVYDAPMGLDEQQYQFTDLFNEGVSGILTEQGDAWYYKHNLGGGNFEVAQLVMPKPSFDGLGSTLQLIDLDADGGKQLVSYNESARGYFELDDDNNWKGFNAFQQLPSIDTNDSNVRVIDLNGDGKPELLITEENVFTWYPSEGRKGYSRPLRSLKPYDEEAGPNLLFSDQLQTVFLADMSGDGMTDIVRIRNGEVCYWPNLGYGKFGAKIAMDDAPLFDHPDLFNPSFIKLADIDGSGTSDIIYLGKNKFSCWLNFSGNSFKSTAFEITAFPQIDSQSKVTVVDLLGNGVSCIVWSSGLPKDAGSQIHYVDLMNSKKPHLLVSYFNNMGKVVTLEYAPSTKFYLEDKLQGQPWITKLHFPVHCISRVETEDKITGAKFVNTYKYHHGYYDHAEREFRGFGRVEQTDTEDFEHWATSGATNITDATLHQEPVISKTWFHTGAFLQREKILTQFASEYWYEEMTRKGFVAVHNETALPDAVIIGGPGISPGFISNLSATEWRQALRACKSMALRSEVFANDAERNGNTNAGRIKELTPYSVSTHNCLIEMLQPKGKNKYAVFIVKESEALTYHYERDASDPRIAHQLNIKIDEYGNVLESASVVYPRTIPDTSLPAITQQRQAVTSIIYTQQSFTNDIITDNAYRLRLSAESKTFELKGVVKTTSLYTPTDFTDILANAQSDVALYHEVDKPLNAGKAQRRLIEHTRSTFTKNDLTGALPLLQLESLAIPFESYQLAYSPELLSDIFGPINVPGAKVTDAIMLEGKFTHSEGDNNWWVRSGTVQYVSGAETIANARNRFFIPLSYTDPYNAVTKVVYDATYRLFIKETEDQLGNKSVVDKFNFRTLSPQRMKDINLNISETISDELSFVKAMAVFGKGDEADDLTGLTDFTEQAEKDAVSAYFTVPATAAGIIDSTTLITRAKQLLQHATARYAYDFDAYLLKKEPVAVATILREQHFKLQPDSKVQLSFEYSAGMGNVVMKKTQAEPGEAKKTQVNNDDSYTISEIDTRAQLPVALLRWLGNGRIILNNKGNVVKQYEPYFSVSNRYEHLKELVETGVSPISYYDPVGRLIKIENPNRTFSSITFDSWKKSVYDASDNVTASSWWMDRTNRLIDAQLTVEGKDPAKEKEAADKAAKHAGTPGVFHFDPIGRPVLSIDINKNLVTNADEFYKTKLVVDTEGNLRKVMDARELPENSQLGNTVMEYKYDMLGNIVYQKSMDAGQRWLLNNILSKALRTWDERNYEFQYFYDILHRPSQSKVIGGDGVSLNNIFGRLIYGESSPNPEAKNLRGKLLQHYDTAGLVETPAYDFKGNPTFNTRFLYKDYKSVANWTDSNLATDLEPNGFTFTTETDAVGRITRQTAPDLTVITPSYNEAGMLNSESVQFSGGAVKDCIKDIDYNEKRQRNKIIYGNDVTARFYYDKETFRLLRLETKLQNNDPLQDWHYTYDPVGNITHIEDRNIPVTFAGNQKVTGVSEFTYDALYRLVEAKGRENAAALVFDNKDNWNDAPFIHHLNPGAQMDVRNYTQSYQYDAVGNITQMNHQSTGNTWVRDYDYEKLNNRLIQTTIGSEIYPYTYHAQHGFMITMPHLDELSWNFQEDLVKTIGQKVNPGNGTAETTYYQYDANGQRVRKITENFTAASNVPTKKDERIYVAGYETYRKYESNAVSFERETTSLLDQGHRFVMIDKVKSNNAPAPAFPDRVSDMLTRFQLHNHLGSAALELNDAADIISYEEYHPFGTTAYQANNSAIRAAAKRYRFTGMERDEETGLEYHSARYYITWLGRWLSADKTGIKDGVNRFCYCRGNPVMKHDPSGNQEDQVVNSGDPNDPLNHSSFDSFASAAVGPWTAEGLREAWARAHPPARVTIYPSDNILFRRSGNLQLPEGGSSTIPADPNIATEGFRATNPESTATAAQHARGLTRSTTTIGGETVVVNDSPWISTSRAPLPESSFAGGNYVIDVNALPEGTQIVGPEQLISEARTEGISHPAWERAQLEGYPADPATGRPAMPPEGETLIRTAVPPEAITPESALPRVTPQVVLPTTGAAGWIATHGTTVGRGFLAVGIGFTVYHLVDQGIESYNVGDTRPIRAQLVREAGAWGGGLAGSYLGGVAGAFLGGGTGVAAAAPTGEVAAPVTVPAGAVIGGFAGSLIGGFVGGNVGYYFADQYADTIYRN
jgi:RHS repeat-associated protein